MLYKIKLLILRILGYEKPLRVALFKYLSLKFKKKASLRNSFI